MDFDSLLMALIDEAQPFGLGVSGEVEIRCVLNGQHRLAREGPPDHSITMTVQNAARAHLRVGPKSIGSLGH